MCLTGDEGLLSPNIGMRVSPEPLREGALVKVRGFLAVLTASPTRNTCLNDGEKPVHRQSGDEDR
ncbi:MAG: hypothetical protein QXP80_07515 [Zestosphaera sp.]